MSVDVAAKYTADINFNFPLRTFTETVSGDLFILDWNEAAASVTSVADNGSGFARFTYSGGQTITVGQEITNSGFADSNYNLTDVVSVTDGSSFFELSTDPVFTATGTGSAVAIVSREVHGTLAAAYKATREAQIGFIEDRLMNPKPTVSFIDGATDLDDLATSNVITISVNTKFIFRAAIISAVRFELTSDAELIFEGLNSLAQAYVYTGTGATTFISGNGQFRSLNLNYVNIGATETLVELTAPGATSTVLNLTSSGLSGWASYGTITRGVTVIRNVVFSGMTTGFTVLNGIVTIDQLGSIFTGATGPFVHVISPEVAGVIQIINPVGLLDSAEPFINVDASLNADARVTVLGGTITGADFFEIADGSSGLFITVADAAVAATTINSVSDAGAGEARFNFTVGPTMFAGQTVVISSFTTNTDYNGTFIITAVAAGSFDVASIAFGTTETGSFLSNSVTIGDLVTSVIEGDTLTLVGQDTIDYDGGFTAYNVLTNSFEVSAAFVATEAGSWNTNGIDQTDPRVNVRALTNFEDSQYIAAAFENDNSTATTGIVNNVFQDIDFGSLTGASTMERFKLIDSVAGEFIYTGNEHFHGSISFDFTLVAGGEADFRFKWLVDVGAGYVDLPDAAEALASLKDTATSVTKTIPLELDKGDTIKPQITRNSSSVSVTVTYATIYAQQ